MFRWIDNKLLDSAQKVCDWFQRTAGLTKFALQKWLIIAYLLIYSGHEIPKLLLVKGPSLFEILGYSLVVFAGVSVIWCHEIEDKEFLEKRILKEPQFCGFSRRFPWVLLQVFSLLLPPREFDLRPIIIVMWIYLFECVPRPPSKSKMREGYEKVLQYLEDYLQPTPAPANN